MAKIKFAVAALAFSCLVGALACVPFALKANSQHQFLALLLVVGGMAAVAAYTLVRTVSFEVASENLVKMRAASRRAPAPCPPFHRPGRNGACARVADDIGIVRAGKRYVLAADVFDGVAERERGQPTRSACCKANAVPHDSLNVTCATSRELGCDST